MTETTDPGGSDPAPADPALPDRLPPDGQSITARRAITAPATVDRASRTVEVVWSTGARARNFVPSLGGSTEELDMSPNAERASGAASGVKITVRRGAERGCATASKALAAAGLAAERKGCAAIISSIGGDKPNSLRGSLIQRKHPGDAAPLHAK